MIVYDTLKPKCEMRDARRRIYTRTSAYVYVCVYMPASNGENNASTRGC